MSYDVSLMMDTGAGLKQIADCGNYTYNVSGMFKAAFARPKGIYVLDGMTDSIAISFLTDAITNMRDNPAEYRTMNPKNGWESYEGAIGYLEDILRHCKEHPLTTINIS